jgi:hypothetical protein
VRALHPKLASSSACVTPASEGAASRLYELLLGMETESPGLSVQRREKSMSWVTC